MIGIPPPTAQHPFCLRVLLFLGKPFGLVWVPEDNVQVIYRMSRYAGVRKPGPFGLIRYNGLTETLGPQIYTGGQVGQFDLKGIATRDNLVVTIHLYTLLRYDPDVAPEIARILVRLPPTIYPSIAEMYYYWVSQAAANKYTATELNQADVKMQLEEEIHENAERQMSFLGIFPLEKPRIMGVDLPSSLMERHAQIAQRRENILANTAFHPEAIRRALVTEVIESLGRTGVGDSLINFQDMLQAYVAEHPASLPAQIIDHPPPPAVDSQGAQPPPLRPKTRLVD